MCDDERNLGQMGENKLAEWCSHINIRCNKAGDDRCGWDFNIEFPFKASVEKKLPLDLRPPSLECKIQVKSSTRNSVNWNVKLGNMRRLVYNPNPSFILCFEYDDRFDPQAAYLVHIAEKYIERTIRRLREFSIEGIDSINDAELNKEGISISYSEKDKVSRLDGIGLRKAILDYVGENPQKYVLKKLGLVDSIGYSSGSHSMRFNMATRDPMKTLVDLSLGITKDLEIQNAVIFDNRFGVKMNTPVKEFELGILKLNPPSPSEIITVRMNLENFAEKVCFKADLFFPGWVSHIIDDKYFKLLIKHRFITFEVTPSSGEIVTRVKLPKYDEILGISEFAILGKILSLFREANNSGQKLQVEFIHPNNKDIALTISIADLDRQYSEIADVLTDLWFIIRHLDLIDPPDSTLYEILSRKKTVKAMKSILSQEKQDLRLTPLEIVDIIKCPQKIALMRIIGFVLSNKCFLLGFNIKGVLIFHDEKQEYSVIDLEIADETPMVIEKSEYDSEKIRILYEEKILVGLKNEGYDLVEE
jgi:hypothetical protein